MSEAPSARGIVVAHGTLAAGLVDAARRITGVEEDALVAVSNDGLSPQGLIERLEALLDERPTVIFTDLQSGSCAFVARRICRDRENVAVLTGVNLPVLLDFTMHRERPMAELVPRLLEKGRAGICCTPAELEDHGRRALSSG